MPSIVIKSTAFSTTGLALNSQTFTEDISGLVRVAMTFTTTTAKRDAVSQLFYVDAPPPIFPTSIDRYLLQTEQLYMVDRTVTQSNGLVEISAQYAGALSNALSNPRVSLDRKSVSFNFRIPVCAEIIRAVWSETYVGSAVWRVIPLEIGTAYDTYSGNATIGVKRISFAQVGNDIVSVPEPSKADLILGATATSTTLIGLSDQFNPIPSNTSGASEGSSVSSGQYLGGPYYDRSRSVISLMSEYDQIAMASDGGIDFITPTVFVKTARYWLELT
jgi:hypothetical protein